MLNILHPSRKISRRLVLGEKNGRALSGFFANKREKGSTLARCTILLEFYKGVCYAKEELSKGSLGRMRNFIKEL